MTHASEGVRRRVDGKIRGAASIVHRINGEEGKRRGEAFVKGIRKKIAKRF